MKTRQKVPKPLAFSVMLLIVICLLIALFAPVASAQKSGTEYHMGLQKENNFETRLKANKSFTLSSAKDDLRTAKKKNKAKNKKENELKKVYAIREKVAELRQK